MVLYMGVVALFGVQMIERFFLIFMAPGQHPDLPYLKNVSAALLIHGCFGSSYEILGKLGNIK